MALLFDRIEGRVGREPIRRPRWLVIQRHENIADPQVCSEDVEITFENVEEYLFGSQLGVRGSCTACGNDRRQGLVVIQDARVAKNDGSVLSHRGAGNSRTNNRISRSGFLYDTDFLEAECRRQRVYNIKTVCKPGHDESDSNRPSSRHQEPLRLPPSMKCIDAGHLWAGELQLDAWSRPLF